jgi:hypothetical protein
MKKSLLTGCGILVAFVCIHAGGTGNQHQPLAVKKATAETFLSAVKVSEAELSILTSSFQTKNTKSTWGGRFSKSELQNLLASMPSTSLFVNFRFCTDASIGAMSVMLCGDKKATHPDSEIKCLRNGGQESAFCPTACDYTEQIAPKSIALTYSDYLAMSEGFQKAHPNQTFGGNIDKQSLLEIIGSLPSTSQNVSFRFCEDPTLHQTSVVFIGGSVNQGSAGILAYRNGVSAASFCPTSCNRHE